MDVKNDAGKVIFRLDPESEAILFSDGSGKFQARIKVNANGLSIQDRMGRDVLRIDCEEQQLFIGGAGHVGQIFLRDTKGNQQAMLAAEEDGFSVGGSLRFQEQHGVDGGPFARLRVGSGGRHGVILLRNASGEKTITIDGKQGDIQIENADCAEDFDVAGDAAIEPGTVVVLDERGRVRPCAEAYDSRVAGVTSGAGGYRPAIVLDRRPRNAGHATVALMGKVFCRVDARGGAVHAGALLTTSDRPGHAQLAADRARAPGAVLGKALANLEQGDGLIPVLVTLQ